jgi:hypothetical protein
MFNSQHPVASHPKQTLIFLTSKAGAGYVRGLEAKTFILPLSAADAKRYRYGLVGLKGFLFKRLAESVIENPQFLKKIYDNPVSCKVFLNPRNNFLVGWVISYKCFPTSGLSKGSI